MKDAVSIACMGILLPLAVAQGEVTFDRETIAQCVVQLVDQKVAECHVANETAEVWLHFRDGRKIPKVVYRQGSGFLVNDSNSPFLVTASHVAKLMTSDPFVHLMGPKGESVRLSLVQLSGKYNPTDWVHHEEADVAVLALSPSAEIRRKYLQKRFLSADLIAPECEAPSRNVPLTVFGFPLGIGTSGNQFSPLTRQTHCASDLVGLRRADAPIETSFFILEDPSVTGYSGGPVFDLSIYKLGGIRAMGSGTKLWGLVHGTGSDETGGKLAMVVPSYFIIETLHKGKQKASAQRQPSVP